MTSEEARRDWRRVLNDAERGAPTAITRYGDIAAVVVSPDWYQMAVALLERNEKTGGIVPLPRNGPDLAP